MERLGTPAKRALAKVGAKTASPATPSPGLALAAKRTSEGLPVIYDDICDRAIPQVVLSSWREDGKPQELRRPLSTRERQMLEARGLALTQALAPFTDDQRSQVEAAVAGMLSGFRSMRNASTDTVEVTLAVLRDFPAWAISRACLMIARNEVGLDKRFAPNDAEIHAVVQRVVKRYEEASDKIGLLLVAPVETKNG